MDFRVYHAVNGFAGRHTWLAHLLAHIENVSIPVLAVATVVLWLLARPGGSRRWKVAAMSALGSAAVALLVNLAIAQLWARPRPYAAHVAQVWVTRTPDSSFPSDHTAAAFAIAFAVLAFSRRAGLLFVAAAVVVSVGRVVVGAHYPGDVLAGTLVGLGAALLVTKAAQPALVRLVRLVERVTDPLAAPAWRRLP